MPQHMTPGVYVEEVSKGPRSIESVGTGTVGFIGEAPDGNAFLHEPKAINNWAQFERTFCAVKEPKLTHLAAAVNAFFENGGFRCFVVNVGPGGQIAGRVVNGQRQGIAALETVNEVALVVAPGRYDVPTFEAVIGHCERAGDRFAILDCPEELPSFEQLANVAVAPAPRAGRGERAEGEAGPPPITGFRPRKTSFAAFYAPWITTLNPFNTAQVVNIPPSGAIAGIYSRTDAARGVHKAPGNEPVRGAINLAYQITREDQGPLNQAGVNVIRYFPGEGIRVWGVRTLDDGEWRYINVRRFFLMVEESIGRATRWAVFEPNEPSTWFSLSRDVSNYLTRLWREGALMGRTPAEAFYVKCDHETNPPEVIDAGEVVIEVGIAPVKPAEFIVFRIGQHAGGTEITTKGAGNA